MEHWASELWNKLLHELLRLQASVTKAPVNKVGSASLFLFRAHVVWRSVFWTSFCFSEITWLCLPCTDACHHAWLSYIGSGHWSLHVCRLSKLSCWLLRPSLFTKALENDPIPGPRMKKWSFTSGGAWQLLNGDPSFSSIQWSCTEAVTGWKLPPAGKLLFHLARRTGGQGSRGRAPEGREMCVCQAAPHTGFEVGRRQMAGVHPSFS